MSSTIYGCGNSGFETNAVMWGVIRNCIFKDNGDAAGEYNVELNTGDAFLHEANVYHKASNNLLNLTPNATESESDPLFTDAPNGDFSIGASSPAKGAGWPGEFPAGLSTGYPDIGAVHRQEPSGGGARAYGLQPISYGV